MKRSGARSMPSELDDKTIALIEKVAALSAIPKKLANANGLLPWRPEILWGPMPSSRGNGFWKCIPATQ